MPASAAALVDDAERATCIANAAPEALVFTIAVDGPEPGRGTAPALDQSAPGDPALLIYTSGTTGAPKGAVLSHGNALANAAALVLAWRWSPSDRLLLALPLFHAHGLAVGLHGTLLAGASVVLQPQFEVDSVLDAAAEHDATLFFGVPTMYARLAESARVGELGSLRLCVSGSAPLPSALWEAMAQRSGQRVIERYGLTETLMNTSNPYDGERRAGTVGLPLPGVEVRLDHDRQNEILVRGPNVFDGYWRDPDASAAAFDGEGWLRTGDLGELDGDGYLRIVGRSKELIITGGYNVHPREVEEVLVRHPSVSEVAVIGLPSDEWGEVVTAVVVPRGRAEGLDESDLMQLRRRAAGTLQAPPDREDRRPSAPQRSRQGAAPRAVLPTVTPCETALGCGSPSLRARSPMTTEPYVPPWRVPTRTRCWSPSPTRPAIARSCVITSAPTSCSS